MEQVIFLPFLTRGGGPSEYDSVTLISCMAHLCLYLSLCVRAFVCPFLFSKALIVPVPTVVGHLKLVRLSFFTPTVMV